MCPLPFRRTTATNELRATVNGGCSLALARVQRSAARSPTIAVALSSQLECVAERLRRQRGTDVRSDWSRGLAALLSDCEALDKVTADPTRLLRVPPGMPVGMHEG